jgi:hypothetical protein
MGGSKFTACDVHKAKSQDVQEILEMMTNQALDREASNTPAPPVQHVSGPDARFPLGNVVVTEGSSTVVATGGGKATTMHMPNLPKRKPEDILTPKSPSRSIVTTTRSASSKTASAPAELDLHDDDAALFAGAGADAQMDEVEEHEGLTALLDNGGLGSLEDDPDRSTS